MFNAHRHAYISCIYIYIYIYINVYILIYIYIYTHTHIYNIHIHIYTSTLIRMYMNTLAKIHAYMHLKEFTKRQRKQKHFVSMYTSLLLCVCMYVRICTHIHTYTKIKAPFLTCMPEFSQACRRSHMYAYFLTCMITFSHA
jgi:hypothetical protein